MAKIGLFMHSAEREESRKIFVDSWQKHLNDLPVQPIEAQIIEIILLHPEYHTILDDRNNALTNDFAEHNPFLHMGLHLALREQISTDLPQGIREIYTDLCKKYNDTHLVEHKIMDCLAQQIWDLQHSGKAFDAEEYLASLRRL